MVVSQSRCSFNEVFVCRLVEDTAWHPIPLEDMQRWGSVQSALVRGFLGSPLKCWASIGHWLIYHFDLSLYTEKQKPRVSAPHPT